MSNIDVIRERYEFETARELADREDSIRHCPKCGRSDLVNLDLSTVTVVSRYIYCPRCLEYSVTLNYSKIDTKALTLVPCNEPIVVLAKPKRSLWDRIMGRKDERCEFGHALLKAWTHTTPVELSLVNTGLSPIQCCEDMARAVEPCKQCGDKPCPDELVRQVGDVYGIVIHDGGSAVSVIRYCPWCGTALPTGDN